FFFFYLSSTTVFYILSLHDALPISLAKQAPFLLLLLMVVSGQGLLAADLQALPEFLRSDPFGTIVAPDRSSVDLASSLYDAQHRDRKSTRLNSSHVAISYAVFCLKK